MPASQGDSREDKNLKSGAGERPRASWGMILLGLALLACALVLYLYASSNTPHTLRDPDNLDNIQRATPTPAANATASPSVTPEPKGGAPR